MKQLQELLSLNGKTAIVTGGAKGIGYGIAYRLAEAGAKVLIADLDVEAAQKTAQEFAGKGWAVASMKVDVSSEEDVKNMVTATKQNFGSVDILVNNAGIRDDALMFWMNDGQWDNVVNTSLDGFFLCNPCCAE